MSLLQLINRTSILAIALLIGPLALAANFPVTKTADTNDGSCDADCSLREAIIAANTAGGSDTISVPAGNYLLTRIGNDDTAINGDLDITDTLTLNGAGAGSTIIDGNSIDRVFHVLVGTTVTISDVTIRDGDAGGVDGGGIWNESNVTLSNVTMSNNSARDGGAIFSSVNPNSLTLDNVTLNGNSATSQGGAIAIIDDNASLMFTDVTMS
ncbi:MAG: CSLREA domain-containing protein, partial [Gammaproteobacteria bacterium]|nr:CSLREA domain-containing protein [Gammaproteobacteria bacterium]